jgi:tetratricopeptide (TPR) repeat protein
MKRYLPAIFLLAGVAYVSMTGFQCGSADVTSGKLYLQQKQYQKAEESLAREVQKNPNNEEAWFDLGLARMELKKYPEMNDAFTKALSLSDEHKADIIRFRLGVWALNYNVGVKYYNRGKDTTAYYDSALVCFRTAISMAPDSSNTYYVAALTYYAKKDPRNAMSSLEVALQKKPDFLDAARFLGQLHYQAGTERLDAKDKEGAKAEYAKSAEAFKLAYEASPDDPDLITGLLDAYDRSGQPDKAMALTDSAIARDPYNKVYLYAKGVFLLKQDKYQEAIDQFKTTLKADPEYADAIYNLGVSYLNWGVALREEVQKKEEAKGFKGKQDRSYMEKFQESLPYLEKSVKLRPNDAGLWQELGKLYAILNMQQKSKDAFDRADSLSKSK